MIARAPAKAIVSGEYSVVYGAPALAVAVNRYAHAEIVTGTSISSDFKLVLTDIDFHSEIGQQRLLDNYHSCQALYQQFLQGDVGIAEVLPQADSLYQFAIAELFQSFAQYQKTQAQIKIESDIPLGAGMGSSAATVAAMLMGLSQFLNQDISRQQLFELTHKAEQLQHGRSSGIDPAVCCFGGLIRFHQGDIQVRDLPSYDGWYLLDSGKPSVTTGVCGEQVRKRFSKSNIWSEFSEVTNDLEQALGESNSDRITALIRTNQQLLSTIGVVPDAIQSLVQSIEQQGGAAKVSGAGAITGDNAGLVLIYQPDRDLLPEQWNGKPICPLIVDYQGAVILSDGEF